MYRGVRIVPSNPTCISSCRSLGNHALISSTFGFALINLAVPMPVGSGKEVVIDKDMEPLVTKAHSIVLIGLRMTFSSGRSPRECLSVIAVIIRPVVILLIFLWEVPKITCWT